VDEERLVGCDGGVLLEKGDGLIRQILVQRIARIALIRRHPGRAVEELRPPLVRVPAQEPCGGDSHSVRPRGRSK
jgi:hypothetical protein